MKYQIGDEIIVLHSHEEGKVVEIMNDKMVMIQVRGVKFPAYMDQIDFPYFHRFTKKKEEAPKPPKIYIDQIPKEKPKKSEIKAAEGVWVSIIPKFSFDEFGDEVVDLLKIYLVNKTNDAYNFTYDQESLGDKSMALKNTVLAFQDFYLHDIDFSDISNNPVLQFTFDLVQPVKGKVKDAPFNLKLKAKQIFQKVEELKEKNLPAINLPLFTELPEIDTRKPEAIGVLASPNYRPQPRNNSGEVKSVVDLHIEKLTDSWKDMTNYEILMMQVNEFEKCYEAALASYQRTLIVIHGVGSGRLRDFIHDELKTKREVSSFINQYDPRFGYGATEIFFK
ncbi:MAG: Smr/MutS family protein [Bacteroidota bacterium]